MVQHYIPTTYGDGLFGHEYFAKFNTRNGEDGIFVNREDVVPSEGGLEDVTKGLLKVGVIAKNGKYPVLHEQEGVKYVLVGINDTSDMKVSRFYVPLSEIIEQ